MLTHKLEELSTVDAESVCWTNSDLATEASDEVIGKIGSDHGGKLLRLGRVLKRCAVRIKKLPKLRLFALDMQANAQAPGIKLINGVRHGKLSNAKRIHAR